MGFWLAFALEGATLVADAILRSRATKKVKSVHQP